ncbi:MAG: M48 family metalloprotease [Salinigranum sp.]
MSRPGLRVLMAAVGLSVLAFYAVAAYAFYVLLAGLWRGGIDPVSTLAVLTALTLVLGFFSYRFGSSQVLRSVGAVPLSPERAPAVYRLLADLSARMDAGRPSVAVARLGAPNAFALGGAGDGVVVVDASLFRLLEEAELRGLFAHELAHLESNDGLVQTLAFSAVQTVVGVVTLLLFPLVLVVGGLARGLAWIGGRPTSWSSNPFGRAYRLIGRVIALVLLVFTLLVRAHSRRREYAADDRAVEVTGDPLALARALRRIQRASDPGWGLLSTLYVHGDEEGRLTRLLSTHPPMDERIERLVERVERSSIEQEGDRERWRTIEIR